MIDENKRIVEINGIKIEVDLRTAKVVSQFKVGDAIKILVKDYSSAWKSHFGMIVGFDGFENMPTIIVAYLDPDRWETPLKFHYINSATKDVEICPQNPEDIGIEKSTVMSQFHREISKKEQELADVQRKQDYFVRMFGKYFEPQSQQERA